ncbi:MAG: TetR/AcrR family transcriptional regulator [Candidatus Thermoplasmatota archaeon]|nr:TetR/AcrR family transcriptional regulator [Candidatus Thermoplasmatota archaeon]
MSRTVKDHDVRKKEIVETAERLFLKYGYEETPIKLIIDDIGIAKGTFYHYFSSKDDLLNILVDKLIDEVTNTIRQISEDTEGGPIQRMFSVSHYFRTLAIGKEKMTDYLHEDRNAHIHLKIEKKVMPPLIDCYAKLIEEGNREGLFRTGDPRITAAVLLGAASQLGEGFHDHAGRTVIDREYLSEVISLFERILGTREGLLHDHLKRMEGG